MGERGGWLRARVTLVAAVVVIAGGLAPGARADDPVRYLDEVFSEVTVTTDVVYGGAVNDRGQFEQLALDVYQPAGDTLAARPLFIWAHGGSLVTGDKAGSLERQFGEAFARRGRVFASINYRLMSKLIEDCPNDIVCALSPRLPLALRDAQHDMQAAVRWFRAHAAEFRINPDEISVGGHSAGTAVALLTNFNPGDPGNSGTPGPSSHVAAAVSHSGTLFEPTTIGPGEPPILMFNAVDDGDATLWVGLPMTCLPTTLVGNVCELHAFESGGHGLGVHRPLIIQKTSEFLCRRVIASCDVDVDEAVTFVGPSGSRWAGHVQCGDAPGALLQVPITVFAGANGVELCADGGLGPLQGRLFVDLDPDLSLNSLQLDGDDDNPLLGSSIHLPADPVVIVQELLEVVTGGLASLGLGLPL